MKKNLSKKTRAIKTLQVESVINIIRALTTVKGQGGSRYNPTPRRKKLSKKTNKKIRPLLVLGRIL